eukprot:TRINITY_DN110740_c0_g1_i1.p1 TRINITY_DN110740_c0_g1~~TRINITY_DN110740_c0_g1_i1.p1  ORF type:complete len:583 (-),score=84.74 TRINITY_DN110740_c0_g1_i1:90-1643(-)
MSPEILPRSKAPKARPKSGSRPRMLSSPSNASDRRSPTPTHKFGIGLLGEQPLAPPTPKSPHRARFLTAGSMAESDISWLEKQRRPGAVRATGRKKTAKEVKLEREAVLKRKHAQLDAYLERCHKSWAAKEALINERRAFSEAKAIATPTPDHRPSRWLAVVCASLALKTLNERKEAYLEEQEGLGLQRAMGFARFCKVAFKRWGLLISVMRAVVRFRRKLRLAKTKRKAAACMHSFVDVLIYGPNFLVLLKRQLRRIHSIQRAVRRYLFRERMRFDLFCAMFHKFELIMLKQRWAKDDLALIKRERRRLADLHVVKEKNSCECLIAVTRENYRKTQHPKSQADFAHIQDLVSRQGVPPTLWKRCAFHARLTRKRVAQREIADRTRAMEAYRRELQTWLDIEQAVHLLDPSAQIQSQPDPPVITSMPFTSAPFVLQNIVKQVREWYQANVLDQETQDTTYIDSRLRHSADSSAIPSEIDTAIRDIIRPAMLLREQTKASPLRPKSKAKSLKVKSLKF